MVRSAKIIILDYLCQHNYGIYLLQETHIKVESDNFLRAAWGFNVWVAGNEKNRNGVAILINSNFEYTVHSVVRDTDGCFIIMDIKMMNKHITLANVYGPSAADNPGFFFFKRIF